MAFQNINNKQTWSETHDHHMLVLEEEKITIKKTSNNTNGY